MPGVQFFGAKDVLAAFNARGLQTWGLFQGKQFINAGSSSDELTTFLDMLSTATDTVYTLKVYKHIEDPDDITDKTECSGSFNFKLTSSGKAAVSGSSGGSSLKDIISAKIMGVVEDEISDAIERRLNGGDRKKDFGEIINGYLESPEDLIGVINALKGLFVPKTGSMLPAAAIGTVGVNQAPVQSKDYSITGSVTPNNKPMNQDGIMRRIAAAIDTLQKNDPNILEDLETLAKLSEEDPDLFELAIKKLRKLK